MDLVAGLTTAAVVIPKSMAFAIIAGLPVQAGLYVAFVPMFVYAMLGSSRVLSVSSTTTLAILTATQLALAVPGGDPAQLMAAAATLSLLTGEYPEDETIPGLLIVRTESRMNFASAPRVGEQLWDLVDEAHPKVMILECSAIPDFEYTALRSLIGVEEKLRDRGIALWLAALNPEALKVVKNSPLGQNLRDERMFFNLREAVQAYEKEGNRT
jgi:MFS superfamily sulfate permease-like transporter